MTKKLKSLSAPAFWHIQKKRSTWTASPSSGPHKKFESIPLSIILRNILKVAETGKEARTIIHNGDVFVDNKVVKDTSYPVGLFDTLHIPKEKKCYRMVPVKSGLKLIEIGERESNVKIVRINDKTILKGKKIQLNFSDGKNVLTDSSDYKVGDCVLLELPSLKILKLIKLKAGTKGIVVKGASSGKIGTVKNVKSGSITQPSKVACNLEGEDEEILKERFFLLGEDKPLITVSGTHGQ